MNRLLLIAAIVAPLSGCNWSERRSGEREPGPSVARNYQVAAFDRIRVAGPYDVTVTSGGQAGVSARGGDAVLAETEIVVRNGVLVIGPKKDREYRWNRDGKVVVTVSGAALRGAEIAGSGGVTIDRVSNAAFKGEVAGSGNLRLDRVEGGSVEIAVAGSGEVFAAGRANAVDVSIAGSGDVDLSGLEVAAAEIAIAGSGNVRARATRTAQVSIMGSGDVAVTGGAKCDVSKAGSGNVDCS